MAMRKAKVFAKVPKLLLVTLLVGGALALPRQAQGLSCIRQFEQALGECAELSTWYERSVCGFVAYLDYVECLARIPFGG